MTETTREKMLSGVELIAAERRRQVEVEGWTAEHDDEHRWGALTKVAATLAVLHTDAIVTDPVGEFETGGRTWGLAEKHGRDEIRCLTIAGALIAAEIDRLLRARPEEI